MELYILRRAIKAAQYYSVKNLQEFNQHIGLFSCEIAPVFLSQ
jgi:hypothetical protein